MSIQSRLLESVDKSIDRICPNSFHDFSQNHCAHFVSHVADLDFSFNCREFKGGSGQPANVRVHEIFANCPLVGNWADAPTANGKPLLIFVTRRNNVRISDKFMGNIPQKHVGIYADGHVFHYRIAVAPSRNGISCHEEAGTGRAVPRARAKGRAAHYRRSLAPRPSRHAARRLPRAAQAGRGAAQETRRPPDLSLDELHGMDSASRA